MAATRPPGRPPIRLKSYEFRREREASWRRLEALVEKTERRGLDALDEAERMQLPMLYRSALSSLSVARAISLDRALLEYLEALCQRAYFCVYGTRRRLGEALAAFFLQRLPATVRHEVRPIALAALILLLGAMAGYALTRADPDRFYSLVSGEMAQGRDPGATTESLREGLYRAAGPDDALHAFAAFLFTHNAKVGMLCFALGFAAGVPVFLLLFLNGLYLGAFSALYTSRGLGVDWWGWVLPHGVTELLAVILCAGAGLLLARSLVFPGVHGRMESLARAGREAGVIVVGAVAMFFVAGLLEGFFRQLVTDVTVRYVVILTTLAFWVFYYGWVGRRERT
ncbi:MAG: stage II sporulation protein M [Planctomycetota bacterium]